MTKINSFKDLIVWQTSMDLVDVCFDIVEAIERPYRYVFADQLLPSGISIPSNIAEGQGRQHRKEFLHFISVANGSLAELDTQRIIAGNLRLIDAETSAHLDDKITEVRKMLYTLAAKLRETN